MPRKREPDYSRVWDALTAADRETIASLEQKFRILPGGWREAPPIRQIAVMLAGINLTLRWPQLSESDAFAAAFEELGIEDGVERSTRPSDNLTRLLRKWRRGLSVPRTRKPDPSLLKA